MEPGTTTLHLSPTPIHILLEHPLSSWESGIPSPNVLSPLLGLVWASSQGPDS